MSVGVELPEFRIYGSEALDVLKDAQKSLTDIFTKIEGVTIYDRVVPGGIREFSARGNTQHHPVPNPDSDFYAVEANIWFPTEQRVPPTVFRLDTIGHSVISTEKEHKTTTCEGTTAIHGDRGRGSTAQGVITALLRKQTAIERVDLTSGGTFSSLERVITSEEIKSLESMKEHITAALATIAVKSLLNK